MKHLKEKMENNVFEKQVFGIVEIKQIKRKSRNHGVLGGWWAGFSKFLELAKKNK